VTQDFDGIVVGGGLGGLAAAIVLGASGRRILLLEAAAELGGKAGTVTLDGVTVDTGPTVLTMPHTLLDLVRLAGLDPDDHIQLRSPSPGFRYHFADDTLLDVHHAVGDTLDSVRTTLGGHAADQLEGFLTYSRRIWEAAAPFFVEGPAPTLPNLLRIGPSDLLKVRQIDALRTMRAAIESSVDHPHLRTLLSRYATYNGSDPRVAPATLNCIAHVELALGGHGVEGGIGHMVNVLAECARAVGVRIQTGCRVERIATKNGRVTGVRSTDGCVFRAPIVVSNAEAAHTALDLLRDGPATGIHAHAPSSMSGWTAIVRARRRGGLHQRVPHTVVFPDNYEAEFADIFDHDRPPTQPTLYLCAQESCHGRAGWTDDEPLFVMANAPPEPTTHTRPLQVWTDLSARAHRRLMERGHVDSEDQLVWTRTPAELARRFPGSRGALYGSASNDRFSAFRRPPNRIRRVPGLFLATGSAHPGGGMPLALLSGKLAAVAAIENSPKR